MRLCCHWRQPAESGFFRLRAESDRQDGAAFTSLKIDGPAQRNVSVVRRSIRVPLAGKRIRYIDCGTSGGREFCPKSAESLDK
jgi:hypothetical protein